MDSSFNLVTDQWIPVIGRGSVSLLEVFEDESISWLSGNVIENLAVFRLLLAIAQSAFTPKDEAEWDTYTSNQMSQKSSEYVKQNIDRFFLYGEKPFLQINRIAEVRDGLDIKSKGELLEYAGIDSEKAYKTKRVLFTSQIPLDVTDPRKVMLLLIQQAFGKGGKTFNKKIELSAGFGAVNSLKPGSGLATGGLLHSYLITKNLIETIRLNLLSSEAIKSTGLFPAGVGKSPWEKMPEHQDCDVSRQLKDSYLGRLIPLGRFCKFQDDGMILIEGIQHQNYLDGRRDLSISADLSAAKTKVLWANTDKNPWRELTSILSFVSASTSSKFENTQLLLTIHRARKHGGIVGVWSAGQQISYNAGEQYMTGKDDYVDSTTWFYAADFGEPWFAQMEHEMKILNKISEILFSCIEQYLLSFSKKEKPKKKDKDQVKPRVEKATQEFWELVRPVFSEMLQLFGADDSEEKLVERRRQATRIATAVYNKACANTTGRQMQSWAENKPNFRKVTGEL